jgi:hypothetical protein
MIRAKTEELKHIPWFAKAGAACSIVPISRFVGPNIFALKGGGYPSRCRAKRWRPSESGSHARYRQDDNLPQTQGVSEADDWVVRPLDCVLLSARLKASVSSEAFFRCLGDTSSAFSQTLFPLGRETLVGRLRLAVGNRSSLGLIIE